MLAVYLARTVAPLMDGPPLVVSNDVRQSTATANAVGAQAGLDRGQAMTPLRTGDKLRCFISTKPNSKTLCGKSVQGRELTCDVSQVECPECQAQIEADLADARDSDVAKKETFGSAVSEDKQGSLF